MRIVRVCAALLLGGLATASAGAAERANVGAIGSASPLSWPFFIGLKQGFFAAEGIEFDIGYTASAPNLLQQLSAGSFDIAMSSGLVDPIRAIEKGGPVAIILVEVKISPYVLMASSSITAIAGLKGKTVAVGGFNDITNIYLDRMLAPSGLKRGDVDMKFFGNTPSRYAALKAGAVDAAMLSQPANFYAEASGYTNLGLVKDYVGDFPFSGSAVNRNWATTHAEWVRKFVAVYGKSVAWFREEGNRDAAIAIMVDASHGNADDIAKSYDFLRKGDFFEASGTVSRARLMSLVEVLHGLGDIEHVPDADALVMPEITALSE
jgi:ABC-type nitrate/sulfonate/bicarbonate transport system substrate-binding protein